MRARQRVEARVTVSFEFPDFPKGFKADCLVDDDDGSEGSGGSFAEDESGEDWDELERKAARGKFQPPSIFSTEWD